MTLDELRDEFDWMFEFESRMAERIRDDRDVHSLASYVTKLEAENANLRELLLGLLSSHDKMCTQRGNCFGCQFFDTERFSSACPYFKLSQTARELGVEVDE